MIFLLDVNVLIALIDPTHINHDIAHVWFAAEGGQCWATCPMTENGVIRIVGNVRYANSPGTPGAVAGVLASLRQQPGHNFWPDDISLLDSSAVDAVQLLTHARVTDAYLLALAVAHRGKLATFDKRLTSTPVRNGRAALFHIR